MRFTFIERLRLLQIGWSAGAYVAVERFVLMTTRYKETKNIWVCVYIRVYLIVYEYM